MNYRENIQIWSIVIDRQIERQRHKETGRKGGERRIERERDRETRKGQRERDRCKGEERDRQITRVPINNPFVMSLVKLVFQILQFSSQIKSIQATGILLFLFTYYTLHVHCAKYQLSLEVNTVGEVKLVHPKCEMIRLH